ncbi:acetylglutamate kinase [Nicoliella spurrieriana]|uniref:acetylglutamate kinase n=1 Tax=Nicoliella spurrieriana TaxID=2925830 RepID=A0A976RSZ4_9LACO|nr:acetylglutamate kinase [Nicoliella spurrieriana]UQS87295.1 acetylglutamate kinase [Nicoliella spurrieriana]
MIVIKIGGNMVKNLTPAFFQSIKQLQAQGEQILIVHGGGNLISACGNFVGQPATKINGIRVTDKQMMSITDNVLTQIIQPELHKQFAAHGIQSHMMNASDYPFLFADYVDQAKYGEVGQIKRVKANYIDVMTGQSVGLCASIATGPDGQKLNVNADMAAEAIASIVHADQLVLLTDVPGVMLDNQVLDQLNRDTANQLFEDEKLINGMVPKVKAAFQALDNGIPEVSITNDIIKVGTTIVL